MNSMATHTPLMDDLVERINRWKNQKEIERLEFKEAKSDFGFENLYKYMVALANERGGQLVLGMTDKIPRRVVGTRAFTNLEDLKMRAYEALKMRLEIEEVKHPEGRVLICDVPSRPTGVPLHYKGNFYMRSGESVVGMSIDAIDKIRDESRPDFSAQVCVGLRLDELSVEAIGELAKMWSDAAKNPAIRQLDSQQLLRDAELLTDDGLTYAALILLGTPEAVGKHLAAAEVVFEYRSSEVAGASPVRENFRKGFFLFRDEIWKFVNLRNERQPFRRELANAYVPMFNEEVVREAVLNAVSHRDYRLSGSVFLRQFSTRIELVSPGGFPAGITIENVLWRHNPRNRRIAEVFEKCNLVERSGQGVNIMVGRSITESKLRPDFSGTDDYQVELVLEGVMQDPDFALFFSKVSEEQMKRLTTLDLLALDEIHRKGKVTEARMKGRIEFLKNQLLIERIGAQRFILASHLYSSAGKPGAYTRRRGLDRDENKELLVKHIRDNNERGCQLAELCQVLTQKSDEQIKKLLQQLKREKRIHLVGVKGKGRWHFGPTPESEVPENLQEENGLVSAPKTAKFTASKSEPVSQNRSLFDEPTQ